MNNSFNNDNDRITDNFADAPDKVSAPIIVGGSNGSQQSGIRKPAKQKRTGSSKGLIAIMLVVCMLLCGAAGAGGVLVGRMMSSGEGSNVSSSSGSGDNGVIYKSVSSVTNEGMTNSGSNAITNVSNIASPTVVEITTEEIVTNSFFGQYVQSGAGSGVIITENGYIITCAHVIDGVKEGDSITVKLSDGTNYDAKIIGQDAITDIAVLKIDATGLACATIGDSELLNVGDDAIAIGNPLGELGGSVTNGIISALDREVEVDGQKYNLLQTNAAINPGNSGGGLFNINGELIGVVNAKSSGTGIEGLGFAIPINDAIAVAQQLIDFGYIKGRPQLGIYCINVGNSSDLWTLRSSEYAAIVNYITEIGVYFTEYDAESGQTEGGLEFGDRIVAIDGVTVTTLADIKSLLNNEYKVGDEIKITVARITNTKTLRTEMTEVALTLVESVPDEIVSVPDEASIPDEFSFGDLPEGIF